MENNSLNVEHKTIFVLDHGACMKESSNQMVDFDISTKSRPPVSLKMNSLFCIFNLTDGIDHLA